MVKASYTFEDQHGVWHLITFVNNGREGRYPRSICTWWHAREATERMAHSNRFKLRRPYPPTCIECVVKEATWTL